MMFGSRFISLENDKAKCKLALWGADLLSYCPKGEEHDVFWLGDLNKFRLFAAACRFAGCVLRQKS